MRLGRPLDPHLRKSFRALVAAASILVSTQASSAESSLTCFTRALSQKLAEAEPRSSGALTRLHWDDMEWRRLSLRDPHQKKLSSPNFLQNLHESVADVFDPWFQGRKSGAFEAMLREQHRVLAQGRDGGRTYGGASASETNPYPGLLRNELGPNLMVIATPVWFEKHLRGEIPPTAAKNLRALEKSGKTQIYELPHPIRVVGVGKKAQPYQQLTNTYLEIDYADDIQSYLAVAGKTMRRVRDRMKDGRATSADVVEGMSDYLYYTVRCHPFRRLNFSLFMSQVNYVLMENGLRGITPDNLDYILLVSTRDEFRVEFAKRVSIENPPNSKP